MFADCTSLLFSFSQPNSITKTNYYWCLYFKCRKTLQKYYITLQTSCQAGCAVGSLSQNDNWPLFHIPENKKKKLGLAGIVYNLCYNFIILKSLCKDICDKQTKTLSTSLRTKQPTNPPQPSEHQAAATHSGPQQQQHSIPGRNITSLWPQNNPSITWGHNLTAALCILFVAGGTKSIGYGCILLAGLVPPPLTDDDLLINE